MFKQLFKKVPLKNISKFIGYKNAKTIYTDEYQIVNDTLMNNDINLVNNDIDLVNNDIDLLNNNRRYRVIKFPEPLNIQPSSIYTQYIRSPINNILQRANSNYNSFITDQNMTCRAALPFASIIHPSYSLLNLKASELKIIVDQQTNNYTDNYSDDNYLNDFIMI